MKIQSKIEVRAMKMTFVGFEDGPGAVRYYNATKHLIGVSRDAWFNENNAIARTQPNQELDMTPLYMEGEKSESGPDPSMSRADTVIEGETHPKDADPAPTNPPPPIAPLKPYQLRARKITDYHVLNNPNPSEPNTSSARESNTAK